MKVELEIKEWSYREYKMGDIVYRHNNIYACRVSHTGTEKTGPDDQCSVFEWLLLRPETRAEKVEERVLKTKRRKSRVEKEEERIVEYMKSVKLDTKPLKDTILMLEASDEIKSQLYKRYKQAQNEMTNSDREKVLTWLRAATSLSFNKSAPMRITRDSSLEERRKYFAELRETLDRHIYGLENVKEKLIDHIGKNLVTKKRTVLALEGPQGVGKTSIIRVGLKEAYNVPFFQINCGGLSDGSVLVGHSETYTGAKCGKIAEIMTRAGCNNPIIYLDEIDKISEHKNEINGILMHILDNTQNSTFYDQYFSMIPIDLSNVMFVVSFNDRDKIDPILLDRLNIVQIPNPGLEEKINIIKYSMLQKVADEMNLTIRDDTRNNKRRKTSKNCEVVFTDEMVEYLIRKVETKSTLGMRSIYRALDDLLTRVNQKLLTENISRVYVIEKEMIDAICGESKAQLSREISMMYI